MSSDERVASAISHWGPRFTTNGVAVADFARVTGGLTGWSDWCAAWSRVAAEHEALGAEAMAQRRTRSAGQHYAQAAVYYHFAKFLFVQDLDQMRAAHASRRALPGHRAAATWTRPAGGWRSRTPAPGWSACCACRPGRARTRSS